MTHCKQCGQGYHQADSCTFRYVEIEGQIFAREGEYEFGKSFAQDTNLAGIRCDDCGVVLGKIHHFGCGEEVCPKCGDKLTTCACDQVYPLYEKTQVK